MILLVMCFHSNKLVADAQRIKDFIKIAALNSIPPTFKIDWIDLLAVQGILKHLLQHHSLNAKSPIVSFYNQTKS